MRTVFMGTPEFAVPILEALADSPEIELAAVFTQPDSVSKRGNKAVPSPVRVAAERLGVPVRVPATLRTAEAGNLVEELAPQAIVVASYGNMLTQRILDIPEYGCINVHASLLPRWRGAAPVERAILSGDELTGVSIMKMDEGLDTGDYCMQRVVQVGDRNAVELTRVLAELGAETIVEALAAIRHGEVSWVEQDEARHTYAQKIDKREMMLSPELSAHENTLRVRAATDHAPARAEVCGRPMAVLGACEFDPLVEGFDAGDMESGSVRLVRKRLLLGCADGTCMDLSSVKPDGKKQMAAADFCAGTHGALKSGTATWKAL